MTDTAISTETRIDTCEGKYTVILRSDGTSAALRYGEAWPAYDGCVVLDNLTTALARDLDAEREATHEIAGEAYQVIAAIAEAGGLFDDPAVQRALDYFGGDLKGEILPFIIERKEVAQ